MITILTLPLLIKGDYFIIDDTISDKQYNETSYTLNNQNDNYSINYDNVARENISRYEFNYNYSNIVLRPSNEILADRTTSDRNIDFDIKNDEYPDETDIYLEAENGNNYNSHIQDLSIGKYHNTSYDSTNDEITLTEDNKNGYYETNWVNYSEKRSINSFNIEDSYDKVEYKLNESMEYETAKTSDGSINSIPSGTTSDSFKYKIYINDERSKINESYIYQIEDDTTLQKIDKNTGNIVDSTSGYISWFQDFVVGQDYIYLADDTHLQKYNKTNLNQIWEIKMDTSFGFQSVGLGDYIYASAENENKLYKIDKSGNVVKTQSGYFEETSKSIEVNDNGLFTASNSTGYIYKFSKVDLTVKSDYYINNVQTIDARSNYVYAISNRTVYKINLETANKLWEKDTSTIMADVRLSEINYHPERDNYPISVSYTNNDFLLLDDLGEDYKNYYNKDKHYYLEGNKLYYGVNVDGRYKDNIYKNINLWYNDDLGDNSDVKSYLEVSGTEQKITKFKVNYNDGINLDINAYNPDNELFYYKDIFLKTNNDYSDNINNKIKSIDIDGDKWDNAEVYYNFEESWNNQNIENSKMTYNYNSTNKTLKKSTKDISNTTDLNLVLDDDKYKDLEYINTTHNNNNNISLDSNMTLEITYIIYKKSGASDYIELMSSLSFFSLLFLTIATGIIAVYSHTAGVPILVFVLGLYPLSMAGIVSWAISIIISILFLGFYILYSTKRENKV